MNEAQKNSVRNLQNLYSIVVGVALSYAIINILDTKRGPVPLKLELGWFFVAFLVTLIPFYHGALRHLDSTYVEGGGKQVRSGALLADFLLLFVEACLLLSLAFLLPVPQFFSWALGGLFALDTLWALLAHLAFTQEVRPKAELRWFILNLLAGVLLFVYLSTRVFPPTAALASRELLAVVTGLAILRSVLDYCWCWDFYYPQAKSR